MIDWHSHILHGVDDGAPDIEHSLAMASLLAAQGFTTIHCTPHYMKGCYEASNNEIRSNICELQGRINENGMAVTLLPGREYSMDEYMIAALEDPLPLGDSRLILMEIPPHISSDMVKNIAYNTVRAGFTPVIAHPERCPLLEICSPTKVKKGFMGRIATLIAGKRHDEDTPLSDSTGNQLLDYLRDLGCHFQGNIGSFSGFYGRHVATVADSFRHHNIYDRYGSDLHSPDHAGIILGSVPLLFNK